MHTAIGIDLGTTNTAVAVLVDGRPKVLADDKGYRVMPSVVTIDEYGTEIVGHAARNRILTDPDRTVYAIKRLIGRRFDSAQVTEARQRMGFDIEAGPDGGCMVIAASQRLTPVEVSAMILRTAREMAERALGEPVEEAVITVPAYFNNQQRTATYQAAELAGMRCDRLINEPTAAALAFGFRRDLDRTLLIFDLGGGTFDVSVLHIAGGVYEILSTRGDTFLGGEDFDYRLVDYLADHFQSDTGFDLRHDRMALQRIKDAAERAKCELSFTDRTTVLVPHLTPDANLELAVTRLTLEGLVEDLVQRSVEVTRKALADANLQIADIDDVILVGGQTRMPRVREAISGLFGKEPSRGVHPEEVVAIGAAVHAAGITDADDAPQHVLIDVTPFDLGIDVAGGLFQTVLTRNIHVPTSDTRTFATTQDDQDSVRITVRQGDSRFADENEFLGEFTMHGLTPAPRMETKLDVTFRIDSSGMLHVSAVEPGVSEVRQITVRNYGEVAGSKGSVAAQIEGDGKGNDQVDQTAVSEAAAPMAAETGRQSFLGSLLGRRKKKPQPQPQPPSAPETTAKEVDATDPAPPQDQAPPDGPSDGVATPASSPPPSDSSSRISLPHVDLLDELTDAGLEPLEGELVETDDDDLDFDLDAPAPVSESADEAASVGLAGSALDAWDDSDDAHDSFALPSFDDEDEDEGDSDFPVGLAGGGFGDAADADFADADFADDALADLGAAAFDDVDADALADLGNEAFADLASDSLLPADPTGDDAPSGPVAAVPTDEADDVPYLLPGTIASPDGGSEPAPAPAPAPTAADDPFDLGGDPFDLGGDPFDMAEGGFSPAAQEPAAQDASAQKTPDKTAPKDDVDEPLFLPPPTRKTASDGGAGDAAEPLYGLPGVPPEQAVDSDSADRLFRLP
ncbi:MAG: Hsp70 family protein, partial [Oligoflexia bacterium]|nr:Hsp70 family protein [Oligoflexia bacterium]